MPHIGITTRAATCAICKVAMAVGTHVYFDSTKRQGSHLAHVPCWDKLRASRPKAKPERKPAISTEPLDPPF